jgi:hypothetical protein
MVALFDPRAKLQKRHHSMLDKRNGSVTVAHQPHTGIGAILYASQGGVFVHGTQLED